MVLFCVDILKEEAHVYNVKSAIYVYAEREFIVESLKKKEKGAIYF